ncbi:hypothetical protein BJY04DRAFT_72518 [Aspergillus karnatakaensis]|uniref:uncharacterized protein n=1 Tax=Aspergillus karnatakaensis TaxID=1810916 RepID=UPI003CCDFFC8
MRISIIAFLAGLLAPALASPTTRDLQIIDSDQDTSVLDINASLLGDNGYISAWESVTGAVPANAVGDIDTTKRAVGPINGRNNYVTLFYKNGRYVVSLVMVSDVRGGLKDAFTGTGEIATAVARNARHIMGEAVGKWASTSWAFYSNVAYSEGFTIVAKNLLPRGVQDYNDALKAAEALAGAYGMSKKIEWHYPKNDKRDENSDIQHFTILADFTPSVDLANYLFDTFHNVNHTALTGGTGQSLLSKRASWCIDYNEKERIKQNWVPWNTDYDAGCIGELSDFDN